MEAGRRGGQYCERGLEVARGNMREGENTEKESEVGKNIKRGL